MLWSPIRLKRKQRSRVKGQDHKAAEVQACCRLSQLSAVSTTQLPCGSYQRNKYERLENKPVRGRGEERGDKGRKEEKIKGQSRWWELYGFKSTSGSQPWPLFGIAWGASRNTDAWNPPPDVTGLPGVLSSRMLKSSPADFLMYSLGEDNWLSKTICQAVNWLRGWYWKAGLLILMRS